MPALTRTYKTQEGIPASGLKIRLSVKNTNTPLPYALVEGGLVIRGQDIITDTEGKFKVWPAQTQGQGFRLTVIYHEYTVMVEDSDAWVGPEGGTTLNIVDYRSPVVARVDEPSGSDGAPVSNVVVANVDEPNGPDGASVLTEDFDPTDYLVDAPDAPEGANANTLTESYDDGSEAGGKAAVSDTVDNGTEAGDVHAVQPEVSDTFNTEDGAA